MFLGFLLFVAIIVVGYALGSFATVYFVGYYNEELGYGEPTDEGMMTHIAFWPVVLVLSIGILMYKHGKKKRVDDVK